VMLIKGLEGLVEIGTGQEAFFICIKTNFNCSDRISV
jgi:hypothetical protein